MLLGSIIGALAVAAPAAAADAELIVHHGKIVTVDPSFSVRSALAVKDGRLVRIGTDAEVLALKGAATTVIDLAGRMVLPGLIDSHVHPGGASMIEFDHPVPDMETIQDVLDYIKARAKVVKPGDWIVVRQVFITRLREQRYPTKAELDAAAPGYPVVFSTGPDASVNSLALARSGIDKNFKETGAGLVVRDPTTGEPTGILRSASQYLKIKADETPATESQRDERLLRLFHDYNSVGITGIIDRNASAADVARYRRLHQDSRLPLRVRISQGVETTGPVEKIIERIRAVARDPLCGGDARLRIIGIKTFLDGGMLTGSAYMREPWGVSRIYAINDPGYRGLLYIARERLLPMVRATVDVGLQFTAHSVGDGAVHTLLDVYDEINRTRPIAPTRPCLTHSNFMSREAVAQAARLGVVVDLQPAWLYLDTRTLVAQFGYDRLRYFQPLKSLFAAGVVAGGGSDHMQKIGSLRSINPYNPFLGMWVTITRRAKWFEAPLHPEEALTREQAIRFYTRNNAYLLFLENEIGSLEAGKRADFVVLDRDLLTCPVDAIKDCRVLATYLDGRQVYRAQPER